MLLARLSSANCLQAFLWASFRSGFLLGWRPCKPTCCSVWRMVWALTSWPSTSATSKAMLAALMRLFFEASFWILTHSTRTGNPSWKTSVWPWPLYCNSVPGCYRTSYSLGHGSATRGSRAACGSFIPLRWAPCMGVRGWGVPRLLIQPKLFPCTFSRSSVLK